MSGVRVNEHEPHTAEGHGVTAVGVEFVLGVDELFTVLVVCRTSETDVTAGTASTHHRDLAISTILLGKVGCLQHGVLGSGLHLLELELVHALCGDERNEEKEGGETREEHGGCEAKQRESNLFALNCGSGWGDVPRSHQFEFRPQTRKARACWPRHKTN